MRWRSKPSSSAWWLSYPNLVGAIAFLGAAGQPQEETRQAQGALSGSTPPVWSRPDPADPAPTLLFTNGASLTSYLAFGVTSAWMNLGANTPMTLLFRLRWTGGQGGIAERIDSVTGWTCGVDNSNAISFIKHQLSNATAKQAGGVLTANVWTTVAITYDPSVSGVNGGGIAIYYDAVDKGANAVWSGNNAINTSDSTLALVVGNATVDFPGLGNPTITGSFGGNLSWLFAFNRVLTQVELREWSYGATPAQTIWSRYSAARTRQTGVGGAAAAARSYGFILG